MATNVPKLGEILHGKHERDAIHIAIAPVVAAYHLKPGNLIGLNEEGKAVYSGQPIGIVDPFLLVDVKPNEQFYMFLLPYTITSLRHEWTHPAFTDKPEGDATPAYVNQDPDLVQVHSHHSKEWYDAKDWLIDFASDVGLSLEGLLAAAGRWRQSGGFETLPFDTPDRCYGEIDLFWEYYEFYTGEKVSDTVKENFFTCSC